MNKNTKKKNIVEDFNNIVSNIATGIVGDETGISGENNIHKCKYVPRRDQTPLINIQWKKDDEKKKTVTNTIYKYLTQKTTQKITTTRNRNRKPDGQFGCQFQLH